MEPGPPHWELGVSATGPPGKSLSLWFWWAAPVCRTLLLHKHGLLARIWNAGSLWCFLGRSVIGVSLNETRVEREGGSFTPAPNRRSPAVQLSKVHVSGRPEWLGVDLGCAFHGRQIPTQRGTGDMEQKDEWEFIWRGRARVSTRFSVLVSCVAVTSYRKLSGLRQHKFIRRPEGWHRPLWAKVKLSAGWGSRL